MYVSRVSVLSGYFRIADFLLLQWRGGYRWYRSLVVAVLALDILWSSLIHEFQVSRNITIINAQYSIKRLNSSEQQIVVGGLQKRREFHQLHSFKSLK